jgi:pyridoxamine 5'-phosphate oxidase
MDDASLESLRQEYTAAGLAEEDLAGDPFTQFSRWMRQAHEAELWEPNAMVLSTVGADGLPSSRMVLLKGMGSDGFVFYTNYRSRKAIELDANPRCCLLFPWHALQRQVRIEGVAERVSRQVSDAYFAGRPRGSQLGALASPQSAVVPDRASLDHAYAEAADRWPAPGPIPRPEHWGGYRVAVVGMEFWQGRAGRMHDRLRFRRTPADAWLVERLAP